MELPFSTPQLLIIASPIALSLTILLICLTIPYFNFSFLNNNNKTPTQKPIPTKHINIKPADLTARELPLHQKLRSYEAKMKRVGWENWTLKDDMDVEEVALELEKAVGERFAHFKGRVIFTVAEKSALNPPIERIVFELIVSEVLGLVVVGGVFMGLYLGLVWVPIWILRGVI